MTRFYVYHRKAEDRGFNVFVEENKLKEFAHVEYDPNIMSFANVTVEADTPHEANEAYQNLGEADMTWVDEPYETAYMSKAIEVVNAAKARLGVAQAYSDAIDATLKMHEMHQIICKMAKQIAYVSQMTKKQVTPEHAYDLLKDQFVKNIGRLKYNEPE